MTERHRATIATVLVIIGLPVAFAMGGLAHWLEQLSGSRYVAYAVGLAGVACFFLVARLIEPPEVEPVAPRDDERTPNT